MSRTTRIPDRFVSGGAVVQDGKLPLYQCNTCHAEVVWATSKRTGGKYLVNVRRGYLDQRFYAKTDIHRCEERTTGFSQTEEIARLEALRIKNKKRDADFDAAITLRDKVRAMVIAGTPDDEIDTFIDEWKESAK